MVAADILNWVLLIHSFAKMNHESKRRLQRKDKRKGVIDTVQNFDFAEEKKWFENYIYKNCNIDRFVRFLYVLNYYRGGNGDNEDENFRETLKEIKFKTKIIFALEPDEDMLRNHQDPEVIMTVTDILNNYIYKFRHYEITQAFCKGLHQSGNVEAKIVMENLCKSAKFFDINKTKSRIMKLKIKTLVLTWPEQPWSFDISSFFITSLKDLEFLLYYYTVTDSQEAIDIASVWMKWRPYKHNDHELYSKVGSEQQAQEIAAFCASYMYHNREKHKRINDTFMRSYMKAKQPTKEEKIKNLNDFYKTFYEDIKIENTMDMMECFFEILIAEETNHDENHPDNNDDTPPPSKVYKMDIKSMGVTIDEEANSFVLKFDVEEVADEHVPKISQDPTALQNIMSISIDHIYEFPYRQVFEINHEAIFFFDKDYILPLKNIQEQVIKYTDEEEKNMISLEFHIDANVDYDF